MLNTRGLRMTAIPRNGSVSCDSSPVRLCLAFCRVAALCLVSVGVFLYCISAIKLLDKGVCSKVCVGCVNTCDFGS